MLDYLDPGASDIILDVGCGPGTQLIDMASFIKLGFGIDLSEKMIAMAENRAKKCDNLKFYVSSAESLPNDISDVGINKISSVSVSAAVD